jgi:hypothetical protein
MKTKRPSIVRLRGGGLEGVPDILMQPGAQFTAGVRALFKYAQINPLDQDAHYRLLLWLASRIFPAFDEPPPAPLHREERRQRGRPPLKEPTYDLTTALKVTRLWSLFREDENRRVEKLGTPRRSAAALVKPFFAKHSDLLPIFQGKGSDGAPSYRTIQRLVKLARDAEKFHQISFASGVQRAPAELIQSWDYVRRLPMPADALDSFLRRLFALDLTWERHQKRFLEIADEASFFSMSFQRATGFSPSNGFMGLRWLSGPKKNATDN